MPEKLVVFLANGSNREDNFSERDCGVAPSLQGMGFAQNPLYHNVFKCGVKRDSSRAASLHCQPFKKTTGWCNEWINGTINSSGKASSSSQVNTLQQLVVCTWRYLKGRMSNLLRLAAEDRFCMCVPFFFKTALAPRNLGTFYILNRDSIEIFYYNVSKNSNSSIV